MRLKYYPDTDSALLQCGADHGESAVNITHLAFGWLSDEGLIRSISFDEASWQFGIEDLGDRAPQIGWRVCGAVDERNGVPQTDHIEHPSNDLSFVYYPDTDALLIEFTEGPSARVVDITNSDFADVNADGSLNAITISRASKVLGCDDLASRAPEIAWTVADQLVPAA